jgi:predicted Fe-Mo cluster-binding NifX family protein
MKIAIVSSGENSSDMVSDSFARCVGFFLFDTESGETEYHRNPFRNYPEHAGEEASGFLTRLGVKRIIGYEFGAKARKTAGMHKIQLVILGRENQKVDDVLKLLKSAK